MRTLPQVTIVLTVEDRGTVRCETRAEKTVLDARKKR